MKKISYLFLFVFALLLVSCSQKNELSGTISVSDCDGKKVYLLTMADFEAPFQPVDSTVIANGKFSFELKDVPNEGVSYIVIAEAPQTVPNGIPFVYEKGQITVSIDSIARVTGTPMNDRCQAFFDKLNVVWKKGEVLAGKISQTENETERQQYFAEMVPLNEEAKNIMFSFVKENIKNKVGEFYFIDFSDYFTEEEAQQLLAEASPEYNAKVKARLENIMAEYDAESEEQSFIGQNYVDVSGLTPNGTKISLSDYVVKNKVVLIDFWASWCGPCVKEMPNVVEAYKKYKSKGFEIVGISLDDDKTAWTNGIRNMNMTWPQMSDLKGWDSELGAAYQISSIPFTLLVNQDGKIIAQDLRGEDLSATLEELLK